MLINNGSISYRCSPYGSRVAAAHLVLSHESARDKSCLLIRSALSPICIYRSLPLSQDSHYLSDADENISDILP